METTTATPNGGQHHGQGAGHHGYGTAGAPVRRLTRKNSSLAGVAGGFADYIGVDPTLVRLGLVAGAILTFPVVPIAYVAAWAIIPEEDATTPPPPQPVPPAPQAAHGWSPVPPAPTGPTPEQDSAEAMAKARAEVEAVDRSVIAPRPPAPTAPPVDPTSPTDASTDASTDSPSDASTGSPADSPTDGDPAAGEQA